MFSSRNSWVHQISGNTADLQSTKYVVAKSELLKNVITIYTCMKAICYELNLLQVKSYSLAYNRCETRDKWQLGRDQDKKWCYLHTSVEFFGCSPRLHGHQRQRVLPLNPRKLYTSVAVTPAPVVVATRLLVPSFMSVVG
jgi:hypothetical protein